MTRPRRSLLFMPGSNARALEKARTLRGGRHHPRSGGFGCSRRQGGGPRADRQGGRRQGFRQARGPDPHQRARHALVGRRHRHGRQGAARRHPGSEDLHRRRSQRGRRPPQRHQCACLDPGLGDDRDRARGARRRQARRRIEGFRNPARRLRVRAERYLARNPDPDEAGPRRDDPDDHALHPGDPRARARRSSTAPMATSAMSTALPTNARRVAISASTARR